ncbi:MULTISPECIES: OmpA family protein [unclassified Mycobacterium]|uniref:channel-forming protein ArfA/OmpATb n=1 Tax=unclassified Mycobacterium TaxID=2642494 RepID=UPI0026B26C42|nr:MULTISPECIES: OmpA family protein [unclassified Mycobacterium]MDP7705928.1 OmpA family protein [Mycobacterium sp. TY815]MDP7725402.1 OmpA family protein [Mycobacterium sp. TY814]
MGPDVGVDEAPAPAGHIDQAQRTPRYRRQRPGRPWLIGVAVIPFLLALIGFGAYERPMGVNAPTGDLPTLTAAPVGPNNNSSAPSLSLSLVSISRSGNSITLIGDFPDDNAKAALMKALKALMPPGVSVIDQIHIDPLVRTLDFTNAEPVFTAGAPIPDFSLKVEKDTVTLGGTASPDQKDAVERAVVSVWPGVNVANAIVARGQITPNAPQATAVPPPGPGACNDLQAVLNKMTGGPLSFGSDGVSLTPDDNQILIRVADQLKACPAARITVNGYTDNASAEGINIPLSAQRATAVAEYLIANGVSRDRVTAKGLGSSNPIASNDTAEGRAKNRRAELVVS